MNAMIAKKPGKRGPATKKQRAAQARRVRQARLDEHDLRDRLEAEEEERAVWRKLKPGRFPEWLNLPVWTRGKR